MAASRTSFEKLQRDRAKKAKAAAKREKRLEKAARKPEDTAAVDPGEIQPGQEIPPDQLLKMVAELHEQFESDQISFEEFEDRKTELFALLSVD